MAFSVAEKGRMKFLLGMSVFEDDGPIMRAINSLDSYETEARPNIQPIFDETAAIDRQISNTKVLLLAHEDGSIKTDGIRALKGLQLHGRQAVGRLAGYLLVTPKRDIYSSSLPGAGVQSDNPAPPFVKWPGGGYGDC